MSSRSLTKYSGQKKRVHRSVQGTFTTQSSESSQVDDVRQDLSQAHGSGSSSSILPLHAYSRSERGEKKYHNYGKKFSRIRIPDRKGASTSSYFKFPQLIELSQKNSNDIVTDLLHNSKFELLLNSRMNNDFLVLTLRVLAKLDCLEPKTINMKIDILSHVCKSKFFETLEKFLVELPRKNAKRYKLYCENVSRFWNDLVNFFNLIIDVVPEKTNDKSLLVLELTKGYVINALKSRTDHLLPDNITPRIEHLYNRLKESKQNIANLERFENLGIVPMEQDAQSGKCGEMVNKNLPSCSEQRKQSPAKSALCQHRFSIPEYKMKARLAEYADELLRHCTTPCVTPLPCGHTCSGTCGSCKQGRIHKLCFEPCNRILICGHKCEARCKDICRPCEQKSCSLRCEHNKCLRYCGELCIPCREPCSFRCIHFECKKLCFEMCDRESCDEPCPEQLMCEHPCIGFCGEPCPPLCRICDKKDLPNFITAKQEPDPRFIFLLECGHSIERNYLDWIWKSSNRIGIPVCPICYTRITYCKRYSNLIKQECKNIAIVEQKVLQRRGSPQLDQYRIFDEIEHIERKYTLAFPDVNTSKIFFKNVRQRLANQQRFISNGILRDIKIKLSITEEIWHELQEVLPMHRGTDHWPVVLNQMIMLLESLPTTQNISYQMIDDVENEIKRLHYMIKICKFERDVAFNKKENTQQIEIIYLELLNLERFTSSRREAIHKQLSELKNSLKASIDVDEPHQLNLRMIGSAREDWWKCSKGHICIISCEKCYFAENESMAQPSAPIEETQDDS